jgi:hypothetical protein
MKAKLTILLFLSFIFYLGDAQVPQGFIYQAVARNGNTPIMNASMPVRITIQSDSLGTGILWQELHSSASSNNFGVINLVLGRGVRQTASTVATFSNIDWSITPKFIKTEINYDGWKTMGVTRFWSVPYSLSSAGLNGTLPKLMVSGKTTSPDEALFEVKNNNNQTIFAVYNEGVRVYVDNGAKGPKGGFAVGGFDQTKTWNQELLRVTTDSVRVYINDKAKGTKGGFAVGGFDNAKDGNINFFNISTSDRLINPSQNRVLWYPLKNAFLTGKVLIKSISDVGENSFATGYESKAKGMYSQAMGYKAEAIGDYSTAIGKYAKANSINSFAFGDSAITSNSQTYAFGYGTVAQGLGSFAIGYKAKATGQDAFAMGSGTEATGQGSIAIGFIGRDSAGTATGNTKASGPWSVAVGMGAQSTDKGSLSYGIQTISSGPFALALGYKTTASGYYSTVWGDGSTVSGYNATGWGFFSSAAGMHSTAFGYRTSATGTGALATGSTTKATNPYSSAFGRSTVADASCATSMGGYTKAKTAYSLVVGRYNDTAAYASDSYRTWYASDPVFICGNGSSNSARSNAFAVFKSGFANVSGTIRSTGSASPSSGAGVEMSYTPGSGWGTLFAYDRDASVYKPLHIYSGNVTPITDNTYYLGNSSFRWKTVYSAGGVVTTSDLRMKDNIVTINGGLETVLKLNPVTYTWKDRSDNKRHLGLVAQEVLPLVPEVVDVGDDPDKTLGINYSGMVPVLINAIQEQQKQIESQNEKIARLEKMVEKLLQE